MINGKTIKDVNVVSCKAVVRSTQIPNISIGVALFQVQYSEDYPRVWWVQRNFVVQKRANKYDLFGGRVEDYLNVLSDVPFLGTWGRLKDLREAIEKTFRPW